MDSHNTSEPFGALIALLDQALGYRDQLSADRKEAELLYKGDVAKWLKDKDGRSKVVSGDVRSTINKVLPSLVRTVLGNEIIGQYGAMNENDTAAALQATEYVNLHLLDRARARDAIYDAMHDACRIRNGILHVCAVKKTDVRGSSHENLSDQSLIAIVQTEGVEVLEHSETPGETDPMTGETATLHNVKIKRIVSKTMPKMIAVPMEEYLIHPDATNSHEDSPLVGREYLITRSDLVAMGYDAEKVAGLSETTADPIQEGERATRRKWTDAGDTTQAKELHLIQCFDLYVRLDADGDGIAELRHVFLAGGKGEENLFVDEYADFIPYYDVIIERSPHQWEGVSITDHVAPSMIAKTALLRGYQDNLYLVNDPQPVVNVDHAKNTDAIVNREPGRPIFVDGTDNVNNVVSYNVTPFVGDKALQGVAYWDSRISDDSGIDDASAGLPPDALQNVTAKASAMLEQKGIAKVELMARTVAECLKPVFEGLLKLTIQHVDKPEMIRLRDKYVEIDPRSWNADMDVNITTGLGSGSRERDMMVMQNILSIQERVITQMGENNPYVTPKNMVNALRKSVQAAGMPNPDPFFSEPTEEALQQYFDSKANQKPLEIQVVEAKAMADVEKRKAELPFEVEMKKLDVQAAREKEVVQSQAAVEERVAIAQIEQGSKAEELRIKEKEVDNKLIIEREKMRHDAVIAERQRTADVDREKAKSFGDSMTRIGEEANKPAKEAGPRLIELIEKLSKPQKPFKRRIVRNEQGEVEGIEEYDDEAVN